MSNYNFFNPSRNKGTGVGLTPEQEAELAKINEIDEKVNELKHDLSASLKYVEIK